VYVGLAISTYPWNCAWVGVGVLLNNKFGVNAKVELTNHAAAETSAQPSKKIKAGTQGLFPDEVNDLLMG
jgi:hypothetical protein